MNPQVLIAGAGPTGLTLGIELARRGIGVRVIDKADTFFDGSRGDGIQPRTLEVFDDLGVLPAVLAAGRSQPLMKVHLGGELVAERRMTEWREPTPDIPQPNPWVLGQSDTEAVLRARLAEFGVRVELSTELADFTADQAGVSATLIHDGSTESLRVDYLVGADGGRSTVRKRLGIAFEGTTDESIRMLLGDVRADDLDHEFGYWFAEPGAPMDGFALTPLPGGRKFQFAAPLRAEAEPSLEVLQQHANRLAERDDLTLSELSWATVWRPNIRLAERFRVGRVFVAGDAAHVHPPTGGQGMNTGIQDAHNLGWKLAAALRDPGAATEALLDTYEAERRAVAAHVLGLSTALLDKTLKGDPDAMVREDTLQLDLSYRQVVTPGAVPVGDGVQAGDRAPDAPLADRNDRSVRLFDVFRGPHATLLVFGAATGTDGIGLPGTDTRVIRVITPETTSDNGELIDADGHARRAYAAGDGTRILVRPDGYVGFVAR